jgi:hypothetical protein
MLDKRTKATTAEIAATWEMTKPLLDAMYAEFRELSKKRPDGPVGKAKIRVVNRLLEKCREILDGEATLAFLDLLDEDEVPQSSDVVLCLSQYVAAMNGFRSCRFGWDGVDHSWKTKP